MDDLKNNARKLNQDLDDLGRSIRDKTTGVSDNLRDKASEIGEKIKDRAVEMGDKIRDKAAEAGGVIRGEKAANYSQEALEKAMHTQECVVKLILRNPYKSIALAFLSGYLCAKCHRKNK